MVFYMVGKHIKHLEVGASVGLLLAGVEGRRRSRSHSWSPRRKRSRSRTPPPDFRRGDEHVEGRKRRGTVPECIYFKRD
ncbi:hypothetical protein KI387_012182, partial [Taxus chinensis]